MPPHQYLPVLFKLGQDSGNLIYAGLIGKFSTEIIVDLFPSQKKELFKIRHPQKPLKGEELDALYEAWAAGRNVDEEGIWVYYPWLTRLIHILPKDEFIELRTNRNHYKISPVEQKELSHKTVGIIGLSVGHSVALTMATERVCGKLKLADFDTLELSNLNRIRTGIQNIGLNKCIVAAREILEIDPFFEIECFTEGITADNIETFLLEGNRLDVLIDECDSLDIKIKVRQSAKKHGIPVMMETSDKGMLDVERFDKEPGRPLFHGILQGIPQEMLENITPQDRIPLTLRIVNAPNGSTRGKTSMLEVGRTISTWPQLASAVTLGGGVVTDVCRRLLLGQYNESGRYYVDLESLVADKNVKEQVFAINPYPPFQWTEALAIINDLPVTETTFQPDIDTIKKIVEAANQAPSAANDQPWKWIYKNNQLFLFHDRHRAFSFANFNSAASILSLGAAYENLVLKSGAEGLSVKTQFFNNWDGSSLVLSINFYNKVDETQDESEFPELAHEIFKRSTNRNPPTPSEIDRAALDKLAAATRSTIGASVQYVTDKESKLALGNIVGQCDRIMMLNHEGHKDFFERDIRWPGESSERQHDGIDIRSMGMVPMQLAALSFIKDRKVAEALRLVDAGGAMVDAAMGGAGSAWAIGIISMPNHSSENLFKGGMAMQKLWLQAEALGLALQPVMSPLYLFSRLQQGNGMGLDDSEAKKVNECRGKFDTQIELPSGSTPVFMFKVSKAAETTIKSQRLPLEETLYVTNTNV